MKRFKSMVAFLLLLGLLLPALTLWAGGAREAKKQLTPGPAFDSATSMSDEGKVKLIKKSDKPLHIAVLGLENNPFWIPVKEGTMKAAEELKPYNCTVEWIVPGGQHTTDVFGHALESAVVQEYDAIATIAGEAGIVPFINKAWEAGIAVATFNSETEAENKRLFFVGADLYLQGQTVGEKMVEALGGQGEVAVITGLFAVEAHEGGYSLFTSPGFHERASQFGRYLCNGRRTIWCSSSGGRCRHGRKDQDHLLRFCR